MSELTNLLSFGDWTMPEVDHPIVQAAAVTPETRWDPLERWIYPWLWAGVGVFTIDAPYQVFKQFLKRTMEYLLQWRYPKDYDKRGM